MSWFEYRDGVLHAEDVRVHTLADRFSTPLYVYSKAGIEHNLKAYQEAMEGHDGMICYAVKANSNLGLLNLLAGLGAGFDIVSGGELDRVLKAGADPSKIVFSGVGKQEWEIEKALAAQIFCFNVESESELKLIRSMAEERGLRGVPLSLRVNPDVDAQTHPYISTGLSENKFGIEIEIAEKIYLEYRNDPIISWKGVDCHIGSQLTDLDPFKDAFDIILRLVDRLLLAGIEIEHVDVGGGLGVAYYEEKPPLPSEYLEQILPEIRRRNLKLVVEPGRSIIADAGMLLTKVLYLKSNKIKNFAIVDAAMNDLIRPSLYDAHHKLIPLYEDLEDENEVEQKTWDVVGPICETGDFLAKNRTLNLQEGDTLAILSTGAYGSSMSSQYNSRGRSAEILVDKNRARLIRRRETVEDLYANEIILSASHDI